MVLPTVTSIRAGIIGVFVPSQPPPIPTPPPAPDDPTSVIVQFPDEVPCHLTGSSTPWWFPTLSGFGVGAIVAAVISGFVLYFIERKRQDGENTRKQMELTRTDQRRWDLEIREAFTDVRGHLATLRTIVGNTRLAAHWSNNEVEILGHYQKVEEIRAQLGAIADSLRVVADDTVVQKFNAATGLATKFVQQFTVDAERGQVTYTEETVKTTTVPPFSEVEEALLLAVKNALKTPDDWNKTVTGATNTTTRPTSSGTPPSASKR